MEEGRSRRLTWTGKPASNLASLLKKIQQLSGANSQQLWCGFTTFFYLFIAILCCFINIIKHFYMYTFLFLLFFWNIVLFLWIILVWWCELLYPRIRFVYSRAVPTEVIERLLKPGLLDPRCSGINAIPNPLGHHQYRVTAQNWRMSFSVENVETKYVRLWTLNILCGRHGDGLDCSHRLNCPDREDFRRRFVKTKNWHVLNKDVSTQRLKRVIKQMLSLIYIIFKSLNLKSKCNYFLSDLIAIIVFLAQRGP